MPCSAEPLVCLFSELGEVNTNLDAISIGFGLLLSRSHAKDAILVILIGYLTILSFAGISYKIWRTPIAGQPPTVRNTRSSLGPWADRVGVLAYVKFSKTLIY